MTFCLLVIGGALCAECGDFFNECNSSTPHVISSKCISMKFRVADEKRFWKEKPAFISTWDVYKCMAILTLPIPLLACCDRFGCFRSQVIYNSPDFPSPGLMSPHCCAESWGYSWCVCTRLGYCINKNWLSLQKLLFWQSVLNFAWTVMRPQFMPWLQVMCVTEWIVSVLAVATLQLIRPVVMLVTPVMHMVVVPSMSTVFLAAYILIK